MDIPHLPEPGLPNPKNIGTIAVAVSRFLMRCSQEQYERWKEKRLTMPYDEFAYAEAVARHRAKGSPAGEFYSTEDPCFLAFAAELQKDFGLEIVTVQEAHRRNAPTTVVSDAWIADVERFANGG